MEDLKKQRTQAARRVTLLRNKILALTFDRRNEEEVRSQLDEYKKLFDSYRLANEELLEAVDDDEDLEHEEALYIKHETTTLDFLSRIDKWLASSQPVSADHPEPEQAALEAHVTADAPPDHSSDVVKAEPTDQPISTTTPTTAVDTKCKQAVLETRTAADASAEHPSDVARMQHLLATTSLGVDAPPGALGTNPTWSVPWAGPQTSVERQSAPTAQDLWPTS